MNLIFDQIVTYIKNVGWSWEWGGGGDYYYCGQYDSSENL